LRHAGAGELRDPIEPAVDCDNWTLCQVVQGDNTATSIILVSTLLPAGSLVSMRPRSPLTVASSPSRGTGRHRPAHRLPELGYFAAALFFP